MQSIPGGNRLQRSPSMTRAIVGWLFDREIVALTHVQQQGHTGWRFSQFAGRCRAVFGISASALQANPQQWVARLPTGDYARLCDAASRAIAACRAVTLNYQFRHDDGPRQIACILLPVEPSTSYAMAAQSILAMHVDVTPPPPTAAAPDPPAETPQEIQTLYKERLLMAISSNIRQSLDLTYIMETAVEEIQQLLQVERVCLYRLQADGSGRIVAEAVEEPHLSILHQPIADPCFQDTVLARYQAGYIHAIADIQTADLDPCYVAMLTQLRVRAVLAVPLLVRYRLWGLIVAHQCTSPRYWDTHNFQWLQQFCLQLSISIQQAEQYQQSEQQANRERLLNRVIQTVHQSLDLPTIFRTTTAEIGELLAASRVEIVQYQPENALWENVASYRRSRTLPDATGLQIPDASNQVAAQLKQKQTVFIQSYTAEADATHQALAADYPGAWMLVPILVGETVWGSLSVNRVEGWLWQGWEMEVATAVARQLAIAIHQANLYQAVQQLNTNLEQQVADRTDQLQQSLKFEELLKRITERVRDSLDEGQILQTAVQELADGLELDSCQAGIYDAAIGTIAIAYEQLRTTRLPAMQGATMPLSDTIDAAYRQLCEGRTVQRCLPVLPSQMAVRSSGARVCVLACPMTDNRQVWGDLWLFREAHHQFSAAEERLAQQVANQCAIALRQSRLYQAAQAQVSELERLNRMKDEFLNTVSHELRTPLANMRMATQMLELSQPSSEATDTPHPQAQYLQILKDECQRETRLINDLLTLTRLDAAAEPLMVLPIDLRILIPHIAEPFLERLRDRQTLEMDIAPDLPPITTDMSYLERLLSELLTNACKFTPVGETIAVTAGAIAAGVFITIRNTGVEIPPSEQPRIFEKFYRILTNDPWQHGGVGLGLALVQKIVERLQGQIQLDSGAGATAFTVHLPLTLEAAPPPPASPTADS